MVSGGSNEGMANNKIYNNSTGFLIYINNYYNYDNNNINNSFFFIYN